jgi:hypothetical protein
MTGCGDGGGIAGVSPNAALQAKAWPEAEALFHTDPDWIGGDAVYSIDLGRGRVLYLFGDSFISTSPAHVRTQSVIVRSSAAIQTGYDPAVATIRFFWNRQGNTPAALFTHPDPARWYWPLHGAKVGSRLLVFLSENVSASGGFGFQATGWAAAIIDNPDADPDAWNVVVSSTRSDFGLVVGATVLQMQDYLFAYATPILEPSSVHLVRWPLVAAIPTLLAGGEWFTSGGWNSQGLAPLPLMRDGQAEFNVGPGASLAPFVLFQTQGFGAANVAYRTASEPTGAWSDALAFYVPPETTQDKVLIYAAKMHPMLVNPNADFAVSYSTNSSNFQTLLDDQSLYFPRFLQVAVKT